MFCGNCGYVVYQNARFCGNCGSEVNNSDTENTKNSNGNLSKSIKNELSSLPLITLIGDTVQGASGLTQLQEQLKEDRENPVLWLFYYEAYVTYKKVNRGANVARVIYNPIGFAISKGMASGLNALDEDYESFNPLKCLSMSLTLCMDKMKKGEYSPTYLLIVGKSLYYYAINEKDMKKREAFLQRSIKYIILAINTEKNQSYIAEYFFYLSQLYSLRGQTELQYRSLNISRKMGFMPSVDLLKIYLKSNGYEEEKICEMVVNDPPIRIDQFSFTYKLDISNRIEHSLKFAYQEQKKKMKVTSNRLKKLFS